MIGIECLAVVLRNLDIAGILLSKLPPNKVHLLRRISRALRDIVHVAWKLPFFNISETGNLHITAHFFESFKGTAEIENNCAPRDPSDGWFNSLIQSGSRGFKVSRLKFQVRFRAQLSMLERILRSRSLEMLTLVIICDLCILVDCLEQLKCRTRQLVVEMNPKQSHHISKSFVSLSQISSIARIEKLDYRWICHTITPHMSSLLLTNVRTSMTRSVLQVRSSCAPESGFRRAPAILASATTLPPSATRCAAFRTFATSTFRK